MSANGLLKIYPETELKFRGPFDKVVVAHLRLTNVNDKLMLFKIKTTAPKKYCVRPNCGAVRPNETVKVMIALQPFDFDPDEKNKHKFMVQSLIAHTETAEIEAAFHEADSDQVMETKLRCVFEMPKEGEGGDEGSNGAPGRDASAKSHSSPGKMAGGGDEVVTTTGGESHHSVSHNNEREYSTSSWATDAGPQRGDPVQEDIVQLRQENLLLNEQIMRLKMTIESQTGRDAAASKSFQNNPYAPPPSRMLMQQQQRTIYLAGALFMVLLGILVGKFVL